MLISWGKYMRGHNPAWPKLSVIGRVMKEGPAAGHATVVTEPHMPWQVEITERCVLDMPKKLQRVCKHRFIGNEPDFKARKKLRLTQREYEEGINQAVGILVNYLVETPR